MIVTDGVFSMDGYFAKLGEIRMLADTYAPSFMVDDCHATDLGTTGPGEHRHRAGIKVDILAAPGLRRWGAPLAVTSLLPKPPS